MSSIEELRLEIDKIDKKLMDLLKERAEIALQIGKHKKDKGISIYDPKREREILDKVVEYAQQHSLNPKYVKEVQKSIIKLCRVGEYESTALKVTEDDIHILTTFLHIFASKKRYRLLYYLYEKDCPVVWNKMLSDLKFNPNTLNQHLKILKSFGMVNHDRRHGSKITDYGKDSFELVNRTLNEMISRLVEVDYEFPLLNEEERRQVYKMFS